MRSWVEKIGIAAVGVLFIGVGIAIVNGADLGNDPVGIFYDGIRAALHLGYEHLNIASAVVNIVLACTVFLIDRRYVNIGTLIYIVPNGLCVKLGTILFQFLEGSNALETRVGCGILGCALMYLGVAMFIVADIGLDPFTGLSMVIANKLQKDFKIGKWIVDGTIMFVGFVLGGTFGVVTGATILTGGIIIQFFCKCLRRILR